MRCFRIQQQFNDVLDILFSSKSSLHAKYNLLEFIKILHEELNKIFTKNGYRLFMNYSSINIFSNTIICFIDLRDYILTILNQFLFSFNLSTNKDIFCDIISDGNNLKLQIEFTVKDLPFIVEQSSNLKKLANHYFYDFLNITLCEWLSKHYNWSVLYSIKDRDAKNFIIETTVTSLSPNKNAFHSENKFTHKDDQCIKNIINEQLELIFDNTKLRKEQNYEETNSKHSKFYKRL